MTMLPPEKSDAFIIRIPKQFSWWMFLGVVIVVTVVVLIWLFSVENRVLTEHKQTIAQLTEELDECRAEATAWYNATTSLSDEIAYTALRNGLAQSVNTDISTAFAVKGHELKCIQPKLPSD